MGYSLDGLLAELSEVPYGMKYFISDLFYRGWGTARTLCDPSVQKRKLRALPEWKYVIENV
jgi:hypothetical protein